MRNNLSLELGGSGGFLLDRQFQRKDAFFCIRILETKV